MHAVNEARVMGKSRRSDTVPMRVERSVLSDGRTELRTTLGGADVWLRYSAGYGVPLRADPFLFCGLCEALGEGKPLAVDPGSPLSPRLLGRGSDGSRGFPGCCRGRGSPWHGRLPVAHREFGAPGTRGYPDLRFSA